MPNNAVKLQLEAIKKAWRREREQNQAKGKFNLELHPNSSSQISIYDTTSVPPHQNQL